MASALMTQVHVASRRCQAPANVKLAYVWF